jgi:hypothetical protein
MNRQNTDAIESSVRAAVESAVISDIHTHLFPPSHGDLLAWGVDELLTYHYLVAELFTVAPKELTCERFWALPKAAQADVIWEHVFLRHGALSEAARGALTVLHKLGLDMARRDLSEARRYFASQNVDDYVPKVLDLAGVDYAVMTNDPFNPEEARYLQRGLPVPERLKTGLRIDPLLVDWPSAVSVMSGGGYDVKLQPDEKSFTEARRFLVDWSRRIRPVYFAASLPPDFLFPDATLRSQVIEKVVIPAALEVGCPFAMMIGVRRKVNPLLAGGGDGMGVSDVASVINLCSHFPQAKFLVTMLARVNQHELAVAARKFANLHIFGCWWFCNVPSIIEEITRQRIELLGTAFTAQHSDARVIDQLIYKWSHTRKVLANVLVDKYRDLCETTWRPSEQEIQRDVRALLGGSFAEFLAK